MRRWIAHLPGRIFLLLMLAGFGLIASASLEYFDFETLPGFMIEKLPLRFESLWLFTLRAHVASALLTFPLCIALMTRSLQRRPALHRVLGRVTGIVVLLVLVPSGMVLALDAKGGALVSAGFLLSGALVAAFMVRGVLAARRRDLVSHRHAMRHVFAQMSVAVSSRVLILVLDRLGMHPELAYVIALWVPVLASAAAVELPTLQRAAVRLLAASPRRTAPSRFEPLKGTPS
jgi:uncharacterized membrane protein